MTLLPLHVQYILYCIVYLNGQVLRVNLAQKVLQACIERCSFGMQTVRHVLTDNLNDPNARLNARLQDFLTQIHS